MGHGRERTERERQLFCLLVAASALVEVLSTVCVWVSVSVCVSVTNGLLLSVAPHGLLRLFTDSSH